MAYRVNEHKHSFHEKLKYNYEVNCVKTYIKWDFILSFESLFNFPLKSENKAIKFKLCLYRYAGFMLEGVNIRAYILYIACVKVSFE